VAVPVDELPELLLGESRWHVRWVIDFDRSGHAVAVTATGRALAAEFNRLFEELCFDERFEPPMLILLDLRELDMDPVPQSGMIEFAEELDALRDRCEGCALAIVCTSPLESSLMRSADIGRRAAWMRVWVAASIEEATAWLASQRALASWS
jgi:hypothetical protein